MIGIVVITHGTLAETLVETATMIMGVQENLFTITFLARDSIESLQEKLHKAVQPFLDSGCLILTDILGGSASNICYDYLQEEYVQIITGVNLPMLIEALNFKNQFSVAELGQKVQAGGTNGIINIKEFFEKRKAASKKTSKKSAPQAPTGEGDI